MACSGVIRKSCLSYPRIGLDGLGTMKTCVRIAFTEPMLKPNTSDMNANCYMGMFSSCGLLSDKLASNHLRYHTVFIRNFAAGI
jgi:hypothetical protein